MFYTGMAPRQGTHQHSVDFFVGFIGCLFLATFVYRRRLGPFTVAF